MMVGRQILTRQIPSMQAGERLLDVQDIVLQDNSGKNILDQLSIHVDRGEIVGIAGVSGNGQSELVRCVSGLQKVDSGKILLQEKDVTSICAFFQGQRNVLYSGRPVFLGKRA